jgi:hypothetical protein
MESPNLDLLTPFQLTGTIMFSKTSICTITGVSPPLVGVPDYDGSTPIMGSMACPFGVWDFTIARRTGGPAAADLGRLALDGGLVEKTS